MLERHQVDDIINNMLEDINYIKISIYQNRELNWQMLFFEIISWDKEVGNMYQERVVLTSQDILEKDFKIDTRGYRPQEVDRFLDVIIKDYEEMTKIINELENDKNDLQDENQRLKKELRNLHSKLELATENDSQGASGVNADLLRRLSNLEKIIYGKE